MLVGEVVVVWGVVVGGFKILNRRLSFIVWWGGVHGLIWGRDFRYYCFRILKKMGGQKGERKR